MQPVFSPDGQLLASGTTHGGLALWSVGGMWMKRGDLVGIPAFGDVRGVAFTPDGAQVVAVDFDSMTLQTFSTSSMARIGSITFTAKPNALAVAEIASGSTVWAAVGLNDGHVAVLDLGAPTRAPVLVQAAAAPVAINAVALSRDGSLLAAGDISTRVFLWDVAASGVTARTPVPNLGPNPEGDVQGLAFAPDGRNLLVSFGFYTPVVGVWEVSSGQNHGLHTPRYSPLGVAFSPRGDVVVAGESSYGWILVCAD
jgi:WD40 repeat protein